MAPILRQVDQYQAAPVVGELERILTEKLAFDSQRWREVEELLADLAVESVAVPEGRVEPVTGDRGDDPILACVVQAGVEVLVSGDRKHLLPLGGHRGVRILAPQARPAAKLSLRSRAGSSSRMTSTRPNDAED